MPVERAILERGLSLTLEGTDYSGFGERVRGKVRDSYRLGDGRLGDGRRVLITTDRISAFDRVLGTLPFKGQILNRMAAHWLRETASIAPNHLLAEPDPNVIVATECEPLPVEFVMRAYLTGVTSTSIYAHYQAGARAFCGHALPEGMKKNEALPRPILTPSTKAEKGGHDESVSKETLLSRGVISEEDFAQAAAYAEALFAFGQARARERGLILADTKYEMGRAPDGRILVIDEVHTPDSSRYWLAESYEARLRAGEEPESFDKEHVRRWLAAQGFRGDGPIPALPDEVRVEASARYIHAMERITGERFEPELSAPIPRIEARLRAYLEISGWGEP